MMKAVLDAGFVLEKDGVIYQEPIEIYKDTAHARYDGALQGDFVYTFVKLPKQELIHENVIQFSLEKFTVEMAIELSQRHEEFSRRDLHIYCIENLIPRLTRFIHSGMTMSQACELFEFQEFDDVLQKSNRFVIKNNMWKKA